MGCDVRRFQCYYFMISYPSKFALPANTLRNGNAYRMTHLLFQSPKRLVLRLPPRPPVGCCFRRIFQRPSSRQSVEKKRFNTTLSKPTGGSSLTGKRWNLSCFTMGKPIGKGRFGKCPLSPLLFCCFCTAFAAVLLGGIRVSISCCVLFAYGGFEPRRKAVEPKVSCFIHCGVADRKGEVR